MEQREKLIELILNFYDGDSICDTCEKDKRYFRCNECLSTHEADYLLANGVVVLPCRCGDIVYEIITWHDCTHPYCYSCGDEEEMSQKITCEYHKIRTTIVEREFKYAMIDEVGDSIFITKEEAERALAKRKGGDE